MTGSSSENAVAEPAKSWQGLSLECYAVRERDPQTADPDKATFDLRSQAAVHSMFLLREALTEAFGQ
jgi:hypothetical protein